MKCPILNFTCCYYTNPKVFTTIINSFQIDEGFANLLQSKEHSIVYFLEIGIIEIVQYER